MERREQYVALRIASHNAADAHYSRAALRLHRGDVHPVHCRTDPVPHGVVCVLQPQPALVRFLRPAFWAVPIRTHIRSLLCDMRLMVTVACSTTAFTGCTSWHSWWSSGVS